MKETAALVRDLFRNLESEFFTRLAEKENWNIQAIKRIYLESKMKSIAKAVNSQPPKKGE